MLDFRVMAQAVPKLGKTFDLAPFPPDWTRGQLSVSGERE
jgi:hypothetical protein